MLISLPSIMVWLKRHSFSNPGARAVPGSEAAEQRAKPVAERLRTLIEEQFPAGSRLPSERTLAQQLGIGRPSLREAINSLAALGVLESRRGSGTYVRETPAKSAPLAAEGLPEFARLDLLEVRKILEPRAAWLAATRATERQLLDMENARQRLELHDRDWKLAGRLDVELHAAIVRGAQNPALVRIHELLIERLAYDRAPSFSDPERMRSDHRAIVEAILKRQADAAEKAMLEHLNSSGLSFITQAKR